MIAIIVVIKIEKINVFKIFGFSKSIIVLLIVSLIKLNKTYNFVTPKRALIKLLSAPLRDFTLKPLFIKSST